MARWNARKSILSHDELPDEHRLHRSLSWPHLIALGVGAIVGTGILTLIGVGAAKAGPSVILSFAIAGLICAAAALAYARSRGYEELRDGEWVGESVAGDIARTGRQRQVPQYGRHAFALFVGTLLQPRDCE